MRTPKAVVDAVQQEFLHYYDTAYRVKDSGVMSERAGLLRARARSCLALPFLNYSPNMLSQATHNGDDARSPNLSPSQMLLPIYQNSSRK